MSKRIRVFYSVVFLVAFGLVLPAAGDRPHDRLVIERLLELPVPAGTEATASADVPLEPEQKRDTRADSKSPEVLLGYWSRQRYHRKRREPSEGVKRRLLEAVTDDPEKLPNVLELLPDDPKTHNRVKEIYEGAQAQPWFGDDWKASVHGWLMRNSRYFRPDLVEAARAATDDEDGWVVNEEELAALARLDWSRARPILEQHASGRASRVGTYSLSLLYEHALRVGDHAEAERLRESLQSIAEDRTAPGYSRNRAVATLLGIPWEGWEAWYLHLMQDESLLGVKDGFHSMSPLNGPVARDPDHWIPRIAALVGHEKRAVHDHAVNMLIQFQLETARADALRPLLPWLFDPRWSSASDRLRLIQSVDGLGLREAIPGLIHVVETEGGAMRAYAADSLGTFRAKEAVPALLGALTQEHDGHGRRQLIAALLACDGLSVEELAKSVEAYAAQLSTEEGRKAWEQYHYLSGSSQQVDPEVSIGAVMDREGLVPPSGLVKRLSARLPELARLNPEAAGIVRKIVAGWSDPELDRALVRDLEVGEAEADAIATALERREEVGANVASDLSRLIAGGGLPAGFAAVVLGDPASARSVLSGDGSPAKAALLACARLARAPLAVREVGELLGDEDALLSLAAERYLEADDSPEARRLVLERHRGEARILGARMWFDPGHFTFGEFDQLEEDLRREVLAEDGPDEIYALLSAGYWGGQGQRIVRLRGGKATLYVCPDASRCHVRALTASELKRLRVFLEANAFEDRGPLVPLIHDGTQFEYVHVSPVGGRRVFMNNPDHEGGSPYDLVTELFFDLERAAPLEVHYHIEDTIEGVEVVFQAEDLAVETVCGGGGEMAVLVTESDSDRGRWRKLKDGELGPVVAAPSACRGLAAHVLPDRLAVEGFEPARNAWQAASLPDRILVGGSKHEGLWTWDGTREPARLAEGWFGDTIVAPDGTWAIAARTAEGENWGVPNPVVRIEVATGKESVLEVPPADYFFPVIYIPELDRVLLKRMADQAELGTRQPTGPQQPEYRLLDPSTGSTRIVTGDFTPMQRCASRDFQPVSAAADDGAWGWVAIPDHRRNTTTVGHYDTTRFAFVPQATFPSIAFDSSDMWIAETSGDLYVAYEGDLLRLPLTSRARGLEPTQASSDADDRPTER